MILKLIVWRTLALIPLLLAVALFTFLLLHLSPGDFLSELSANPQVAAETVAGLRKQYGLDQPWYVQFGKWLGQIARGDFGYSFACQCPVGSLVAERVFNTVALAAGSLLLALLIALPLGALAAWRRARGSTSLLDRMLSFSATLSLSLPSFLLALLAVLLAARTGWFPVGGVQSLDHERFSTAGKFADYLHHLILPATVLALRQMPAYWRQMRAGMLEILAQDYILAARARGLGESRILFKHAGRNALNPILSMFGNSIGSLLSGAFIVEAVMSWPGLGSLAVNALLSRDLYVLLACLILAAALLAAGNLLSDLLLAAADPRICGTALSGGARLN